MILEGNLLETIGWTLIHSIWQISLIGILVKIALQIFRNKNSGLRYHIILAGVVAIVLSVVFSFYQYSNSNIIADATSQAPIIYSITSGFTESPAFVEETQIPIFSHLMEFINRNISFIVYFWLVGVLFFSIRFAGSYWYIQRLKIKYSKPINEKWTTRFKTISKTLNLKSKIQFLESHLIKVPVSIGYLKPAVILPVGLLTQLPFNQIEAIITHELAHIKRNDYLVNLCVSILESVFFYHPVFWWLTSTLNDERENCCDDLTVMRTQKPNILQQALINIHEKQINTEGIASGKSIKIAAALYKNEFQLLKRIKRMKTKDHFKHGKKGNLAGFALLLTGIIIFSLSSAFAPRITDLPIQFYEDQGESQISGILPDYSTEVGLDKVPSIKPVESSIRTIDMVPDSTKKKQFDKQMSIQTKDGKTNIVMEFDDDMNLLSVKENGKELKGEKRKEYEKKAQKLKTDKKEKEALKKKEEELKSIQKKLEEKQKEMQKAQQAYAEASSEYYEKLYEMEGNRFAWFDDSGQLNAWTIPYNFHFKPEELKKIQDQLKDVAWNQYLPADILEPSDYEVWNHENLMDLYKDNLEDYDEVFKELEKVQQLKQEELMQQLEDLEKIEKFEKIKIDEFEKKIYEELEKDQMINSKKDFQSFRLSSSDLIVNGKPQSKELKNKYLKLYKDITKNELKGTMQIIIED